MHSQERTTAGGGGSPEICLLVSQFCHNLKGEREGKFMFTHSCELYVSTTNIQVTEAVCGSEVV